MSVRADGPQKLMDQVVSSASGDPLRGLLATTFELQPEFFETDLLPTLFSLGAWDDKSWTSRIAIERRLAELDSAVVFQAAEQYRGRARSLRLEMVPVPRVGNRVLHAKVMVLVHEGRIRLLVTSANLTEPGYRRNREVAVQLEASAQRPAHANLIRSCLEEMPRALNSWWTPAADRIRERAMEMLAGWAPSTPIRVDEWFAWGGGERPLWQAFLEQWPADETVQGLTIVSPFWSDSAAGGPIERLLAELSRRGSLAPRAELRLVTEARAEAKGRWAPVLPDSYGSFAFAKHGVTARAFPIDPTVNRDEAGIDDARLRALHAKVVLLEGARTSLAYLGSSNFTRHGWGFLGDPRAANVEAGLIVRRGGKGRDGLAALVPPLAGQGVPLDGAAGGKIVPPDAETPARAWPVFIRSVRLVPSVAKAGELDLEIQIDSEAVHGAWSIALDVGEDSELDPALVDHGVDSPAGAVAVHRIALSPERLTRLLYAQYVKVTWWGTDEPTEYPVNVADEARDDLPLAPGSAQPGEHLLLQYYQSRIAFEEMFPPPAGYFGDAEAEDRAPQPESAGVDTSRIQSYQIREFVEALRGIQDDLKRAADAPRLMKQALLGPVSPVALAREVSKAVAEGRRTPTAAAFQFVEIGDCLARARGYEVKAEHRRQWESVLDEGGSIVGALLDALRESAPQELRASGAFARYEKAVRSLSA